MDWEQMQNFLLSDITCEDQYNIENVNNYFENDGCITEEKNHPDGLNESRGNYTTTNENLAKEVKTSTISQSDTKVIDNVVISNSNSTNTNSQNNDNKLIFKIEKNANLQKYKKDKFDPHNMLNKITRIFFKNYLLYLKKILENHQIETPLPKFWNNIVKNKKKEVIQAALRKNFVEFYEKYSDTFNVLNVYNDDIPELGLTFREFINIYRRSIEFNSDLEKYMNNKKVVIGERDRFRKMYTVLGQNYIGYYTNEVSISTLGF
jgi:hypothetical protein